MASRWFLYIPEGLKYVIRCVSVIRLSAKLLCAATIIDRYTMFKYEPNNTRASDIT
jgi:hypothetical protein